MIKSILGRSRGEQAKRDEAEPKWLRWFAWTSLALYAALCVGPWSSAAWRAEWDSALYLETARSLAEGRGYSYLGQPFFLRPPGLSWLLAQLMGQGEGLPIQAANRLLMACAAGAIVVLFMFLRRRFGTLLALAVALLTGTSPLYVRQFNYILSEFPYLLLCLGSMLFCASWSKLPARSFGSSLLQVPLLIGAFFLRSQALLLLPGVLILECKRRGLKQALLPVVLIAGATLPWMLYAGKQAAADPAPSTQFKLHDYSTALFHVDPSDPASPRVSPGGWMQRVGDNGAGLLNSALACLHMDRFFEASAAEDEVPTEDQEQGGPRSWSVAKASLGVLLALCLATGFLLMLRTGWTLFEWFVLGNTALLLVYFTYAPRLAMPLVPALYLYLLGLPLLLTRRRWHWTGMLITNLLALGLLVANISQLGQHKKEPHQILTLRRDINTMALWAQENTEPDAVLLCKHGPMLGLKSKRQVYSSRYEFSPETLDKYAVDYVIFFGGPGTLMELEAMRRGGQRWELEGSKRIVAYHLPRND